MMAANPRLSNADVEKLLFSSAVDLGTPGRDPYYGYGRVNAAAAVRAAVGASTTVDQQPPSDSISAPLNGSTVSGLVAVDVNASDNVGVSKVELRVNGATVAVDTSPPFAFTWDSTGIANGAANLVAYAFDAAGNSASSAVSSVNVANASSSKTASDSTPPVVAIINPTDGAQVTGMLSINVQASDNSGSTQLTQSLLIDGVQVAKSTGGTLSYKWNTKKAAAGNHTVQAVARDAAGNQSSQAIQVHK